MAGSKYQPNDQIMSVIALSVVNRNELDRTGQLDCLVLVRIFPEEGFAALAVE